MATVVFHTAKLRTIRCMSRDFVLFVALFEHIHIAYTIYIYNYIYIYIYIYIIKYIFIDKHISIKNSEDNDKTIIANYNSINFGIR